MNPLFHGCVGNFHDTVDLLDRCSKTWISFDTLHRLSQFEALFSHQEAHRRSLSESQRASIDTRNKRPTIHEELTNHG